MPSKRASADKNAIVNKHSSWEKKMAAKAQKKAFQEQKAAALEAVKNKRKVSHARDREGGSRAGGADQGRLLFINEGFLYMPAKGQGNGKASEGCTNRSGGVTGARTGVWCPGA
jgi:hypothetical protein